MKILSQIHWGRFKVGLSSFENKTPEERSYNSTAIIDSIAANK
jgi:hypothetical protein